MKYGSPNQASEGSFGPRRASHLQRHRSAEKENLMALREHFEDSGHWLFRWRSYLPLVGLAVILLALREYEYPGHSETLDHLWEAVCLFVSFAGLAIRSYTIGHTPKGTSGRNTKHQVADRLNTTGAYSLVRNPLYL